MQERSGDGRLLLKTVLEDLFQDFLRRVLLKTVVEGSLEYDHVSLAVFDAILKLRVGELVGLSLVTVLMTVEVRQCLMTAFFSKEPSRVCARKNAFSQI